MFLFDFTIQVFNTLASTVKKGVQLSSYIVGTSAVDRYEKEMKKDSEILTDESDKIVKKIEVEKND